MSRPYFIRLPKEVINPDYKIYYNREVYPYPNRVMIIRLDYDVWLKMTNHIDSKESEEEFKRVMNANDIQKTLISPFIQSNYNAIQILESTGLRGYDSNLYIDKNNEYVYFYTMERYKRKRAIKYFDNKKFFLINIYRLPYLLFKMLKDNEKNYKFLFWQYPKGFKYNYINYEKNT